ncbi:DUF5615 family PIN-like protein [Salinarimonas sp.]|uniref:DUF5615 family PIN-like protein n=1 Tax=Salinarimonas sp. TaxID=2766526 RepID=UPI0032D91738
MLLDEGAPALVARPFSERGHTVIRHGDVCSPGARDAVVVAQALLNKAVLIAVDLDMKRFARRFGAPQDGGRYKELHLISVGCKETMAAKRLEQALSFIEHEWDYVCRKPSRRMWVDIGPHRLTTYR